MWKRQTNRRDTPDYIHSAGSLLGVFCSLMPSTILCAPLHQHTPIAHFIFVTFCFVTHTLQTIFCLQEETPCMCMAYPRKILLLIIPILIRYVAVCRNIFINIQTVAEERQKGTCRMLEGLSSAEWGRVNLDNAWRSYDKLTGEQRLRDRKYECIKYWRLRLIYASRWAHSNLQYFVSTE